MKLELKHITPYLPWDLKVMYTHTNTIGQISNIYTIGKGYYNDDIKLSIDYSEGEHIWMFKPILQPLRMFHTRIIAKQVMDLLDCSVSHVLQLWDFANGEKKLDQITLGLFEVMSKNHIDFFGLIENDLAINKNLLK